MANIADCVVFIAPEWEKISPVIEATNHYDSFSENEPGKNFDGETHSVTLKVDYDAMVQFLKDRGVKEAKIPRISCTRSLKLIYNPKIKKMLIEWVFDSAWGMPMEVQQWLEMANLNYQWGVVENGCEVEEIEGQDYGLILQYRLYCDDCGEEQIFDDRDERDKAVFKPQPDGKTTLECPNCHSLTEVCIDTVLEYNFTPISVLTS